MATMRRALGQPRLPDLFGAWPGTACAQVCLAEPSHMHINNYSSLRIPAHQSLLPFGAQRRQACMTRGALA